MALGFGRSKEEDVVSLITAKEYGRAIEVLRTQLKKRGASATLRKQLADVLILSNKTAEAIALLLPLADQFALEGFAAKAVAVLKKIQKLDPGRQDVEERLARLIQEKQREAVVLPLSRPAPEIGMEEIGIEPPAEGPLVAPSVTSPAPLPPPAGELEIGLGAPPTAPAETPASRVASTPAAPAPPAASAATSPVLAPPPDPLPPLAVPDASPLAVGAAPSPAEPGQPRGTTSRPETAEEIEDYDLLYEGEEGTDEEDVEVEAVPVEVLPEAEPEAMTDGAFADELMSLVDSVFQEAPGGAREEATPVTPAPAASQIVVSPLFRDFAVDEMVAVIHGLKLLSFERGEVILRQGESGGSLYTLTSGRARAFRKDPATGHQARIGDLKEGAFFGEMSILTGQPRMASVVALTRCELLELDRPTLDEITKSHPHVWDVLREFAEKRAQSRG